MANSLMEIFTPILTKILNYLPNLIGGVLIITVGILLSEIIRKITFSLIEFFHLEYFLKKTRLAEPMEVKIWSEILAEIIRIGVFILFLIPAIEILGFTRFVEVLNQLLFYLPNVFVSVVIGFIGVILANLVYKILKQSFKTLKSSSAVVLANLAKFAIIFFTVLIVFNQLGIAQELIKILFTGVVIMIALAGGLAFGLGGKEIAREILEEIIKKKK